MFLSLPVSRDALVLTKVDLESVSAGEDDLALLDQLSDVVTVLSLGLVTIGGLRLIRSGIDSPILRVD